MNLLEVVCNLIDTLLTAMSPFFPSNRAKYGYPVYRYFYEGNFTNISPLPWIGAAHSSKFILHSLGLARATHICLTWSNCFPVELPLIFGTHYEYRGNSTEFEWETSYGLEALWLSFASNSSANPTDGASVTWPGYSENTTSLAVFAANDAWVQFSAGDFGAGVSCS